MADAVFQFGRSDAGIDEVALGSDPEDGAGVAKYPGAGAKEMHCTAMRVLIDAEETEFPEEAELCERGVVDRSEIVEMDGEAIS